MRWFSKSCLRCGGDVYALDAAGEGLILACLQCGREYSPAAIPVASGHAATAWAKSVNGTGLATGVRT